MAEYVMDFVPSSAPTDGHAGVWLRIRTLAAAIPPDVDLADDVAVVRALHRAGFISRDFTHLLSLAIERAKMNRELGI